MKIVTKVGIVGTLLWSAIVIVVMLLRWSDASTMTMNEWGDFLAGISAPMALFWLVLGYFQQGHEINQSTRALEEQVLETRLLAQNAERQAVAAEQQAKLTQTEQEYARRKELMAAQPILQSKGGTSSNSQHKVEIVNRGGEIRDLKIEHEGPHKLKLSRYDFLGYDQGVTMKIVEMASLQLPIEFSLVYTDKFDERRLKTYRLVKLTKLVEVRAADAAS